MTTAPVSIITGGAGGMGLATARLLGRTSQVVLCDLVPEAVERAKVALAADNVDVIPVACDITDRLATQNLMVEASQIGPVHSIVHAAGLSPLMGSAENIIRVNAVGTINVTRAALAVASPDLAVVLVASMAGHLLPRPLVPRRRFKLADEDPSRLAAALTRAATRGPKATHSASAYSISKNFVIWYARNQARAFGKHGSRILSVSPGSFDTSMGRLEMKSGSERMLRFAALPRFGQPEEIAELLAFCASDKASYLTGTDILCDGGVTAGLSPMALLRLAAER